ncbi:hypothetical protein [Amycolatopsis sp. PS_44_ISF1]|uniref:hypothetical protein n=1 Tax=Amycolatopsis sp. PS_44_ISF1 TaxID=2974917 RepID=UPI0028E05929|nr:hypothetical protein [Amycolatopsis sp. PS_44_ISF1]MDT8913879.1 hypothetical protein [Amycolatopsis sp. PS_44_ISF1]
MTSKLLDFPAAAVVSVLGMVAVLLSGATLRRLWPTTAAAVGGALVLGQVVHAGAATAPVLCAVGALIGLDQAFELRRRAHQVQRKLAARSVSRHRQPGGQRTATGPSVHLAGTAVIVSTATLHLVIAHAVGPVAAGASAVPALAAISCLPALPALAGRIRVAVVERVPALRPRAGARFLSVPHDPRAGMLLSGIVFLWVALSVSAGH